MHLSGNPSDFIIAFLGGVLMSLTPCIYPVIPISAGFIGIEAAEFRIRGLILSLLYVTGIAIVYAGLGLSAAITGTLFGSIAMHPVTHIIVGVIIIVFGLAMMDLFTIPLPKISNRAQARDGGYFSAFLLGLSSAFLISPCLSPVLGSILLYTATKKNLLYGATLLFSFAYGMGFILILIGISSAFILNKIPKSGKWMLYIKKAYALILVAFGAYFIYAGLRRI